jgi:transporter family-2 protein
VAVALTATAGLAGAVQAAVMGELGERVGIVPALMVSVVVALACGVVALIVWEHGLGGVRAAFHEPWWLWIGGVMSIYIVLAVTVAPPRIGVAASIGIVIAGNLVAAALIDQYGLFGQEQVALTWPRVLGLLLLAVGAALSLARG